jgi:hypothetical protein
MKTKFLLTAFTIGFVSLLQPLAAATINWGPSTSGGDFFSNGGGLTSAVMFDMGVFNVGFTPTASNTSLWQTNWIPVSTTSYNTANTNYGGQVTSQDFFDLGIPAGQQVYVWGYNQKVIDVTTQWSLYSAKNTAATAPTIGNWVSPGGPGDQGNPSIDWSPATTNQVVFGATSTGTGGGDVQTPVVLVGDQVQLYSVVPESSSAVLALLGSLALLRRKRND